MSTSFPILNNLAELEPLVIDYLVRYPEVSKEKVAAIFDIADTEIRAILAKPEVRKQIVSLRSAEFKEATSFDRQLETAERLSLDRIMRGIQDGHTYNDKEIVGVFKVLNGAKRRNDAQDPTKSTHVSISLAPGVLAKIAVQQDAASRITAINGRYMETVDGSLLLQEVTDAEVKNSGTE